MLPSTILANATTLDLKTLDVAISYQNYRDTIRETGHTPSPKLSVDQMTKMLESVRKFK